MSAIKTRPTHSTEIPASKYWANDGKQIATGALFQVSTYFGPDYGPTYFEPVYYAGKERCPSLPLQYKNLIVDLFTFRTVKTSVSLQLRAQPNN